MAYQISEDCIKCGACQAQCPADCITEGEDRYVIDEEACLSCGGCASVCPVGAPTEKD